MGTTYIYALTEPGTFLVRYVGKANKPYKRYKLHLIEARTSARKAHRLNWIRKLILAGQVPNLLILEECDAENWVEREQYWIAKFRADGTDLVNNADGGQGGNGYKHSEAALLKLSEASKRSWGDLDVHVRRSASMRGKRNKHAGPMSAEHRANLSAALKGKKRTAEHCANLSAAQKGKPSYVRSPESREHSRASRMAYLAKNVVLA